MPGRLYAQDGPDGVEITVSRRSRPRTRERRWLHLLLFLATLFTATLAGALLEDGDPLGLRMVGPAALAIPVPTRLTAVGMAPGLWFSLPMVCILGAHELGHWALARRHGMDVSPPFFIPVPPFLSLIGTLGAFIRLRSPLLNRAVLLDVGVAGPLAGFALAVPATMIGLAMSRFVPGAEAAAHVGIHVEGGLLKLGESLVFMALRALSPVAGPGFVDLHPMALAGWMGFLFTALNLIPAGQLDGGHVVYAISPRAHRVVGLSTLAALLLAGTMWSGVWLAWAVLILLIGRGRVAHPPVFDPGFRLDRTRRAVAWACIVLFVITFVPVPFAL